MSQLDKLKIKLQEQPDAVQAIAARFGDPDGVKDALLRFAAENGIPVTEAELESMASAARAEGRLNDDDLGRVTGGSYQGAKEAVMLSILTFGVGCAVVTIVAAAKNAGACTIEQIKQRDRQG